MASKNTTVETVEAAQFDEALPAINDALDRFIKSVTVTSTHYRYKAIRAIAFQAFTNAIEDGTFDALVEQAINNAGNLPTGWGVEAAGAQRGPRSAAKKPAARKAKAAPIKGATVATAEGVVIAEQRHIDATAAKRTRKAAATSTPAAKAQV